MEVIVLAVAGGFGASVGLGWCFKKLYDHVKLVNTIREVEREGWTHIGVVKFICIYPIDGGRGMEIDIANFGKCGFQTLRDPNASLRTAVDYDRAFVVYDLNFEDRAVLNQPEICMKSDQDEKVALLWHTLKIVATTIKLSNLPITIRYLDRPMRAVTTGNQTYGQIREAYDIQGNHNYNVAYCSQAKRVCFNEGARHLLELYSDADSHLPNYTSCTMVNTKSIKALRQATGRKDLSHKNFRPQIVFEGNKPYIEDHVRSIKIGNLEFHNVRPCTHDENINLNYEQGENEPSMYCVLFGRDYDPNEIDPYTYLRNERPIRKYGSPAYHASDNPVFGINFHFENNAEVTDIRETQDPTFFHIVRDQQVYARFNNAQAEVAV